MPPRPPNIGPFPSPLYEGAHALSGKVYGNSNIEETGQEHQADMPTDWPFSQHGTAIPALARVARAARRQTGALQDTSGHQTSAPNTVHGIVPRYRQLGLQGWRTHDKPRDGIRICAHYGSAGAHGIPKRGGIVFNMLVGEKIVQLTPGKLPGL
jgi:hypothetical protein